MKDIAINSVDAVQDFIALGSAPSKVFIKYGMDCVGCRMAAFCTLEEAINLYHVNGSTFLEDLARSIEVGMPKPMLN